MGKSDPETARVQRKRQLNVIYFIDSARTRSFALPLGRLNLLLIGAGTLGIWSISSLVVIGCLLRDREDMASRLRGSLATIFDYETRDEHVFDLAYPNLPAKGETEKNLAAARDNVESAGAKGDETNSEAAMRLAARAPSQQRSSGISLPAPPAAPKAEAPAGDEKEGDSAAKPAGSEGSGDEGDDEAKPSTREPAVVVGNPVIATTPRALELRFDLTSKDATGRIEGYIYAVAEFKPDKGDRIFIGAPIDIQVTEAGEPAFPLKSVLFAIRRFKQKSFSFPLPKGASGTFTGVQIGVLDRTGSNRTTYKVPIKIHTGANSKENAEPVLPADPTQG